MKCVKYIFEFILNFIIVHLFIGVIWLNNTYGHTTGGMLVIDGNKLRLGTNLFSNEKQ